MGNGFIAEGAAAGCWHGSPCREVHPRSCIGCVSPTKGKIYTWPALGMTRLAGNLSWYFISVKKFQNEICDILGSEKMTSRDFLVHEQ
jgi:hypothetical protein